MQSRAFGQPRKRGQPPGATPPSQAQQRTTQPLQAPLPCLHTMPTLAPSLDSKHILRAELCNGHSPTSKGSPLQHSQASPSAPQGYQALPSQAPCPHGPPRGPCPREQSSLQGRLQLLFQPVYESVQGAKPGLSLLVASPQLHTHTQLGLLLGLNAEPERHPKLRLCWQPPLQLDTPLKGLAHHFRMYQCLP